MISEQHTRSTKNRMNVAMGISFLVALLLFSIKVFAYLLTGSAAILSDASEGAIHVLAVGFAVYSMRLSLKPADSDHLYGHEKISYFSAGCEGATIIIAAFYILYNAGHKVLFGYQLQNLEMGLLFTLVALMVNSALGLYLIQQGRQSKSFILEANGKHVLTDSWTSLGVIVALVLVRFTGIEAFDPLVAMITAIIILFTGVKLVKRSVGGLMDQADVRLHHKIATLLNNETASRGLQYHHLRDRQAGHKVFIDFHLLFPRDVKLAAAHEMASEIEASLGAALDLESEIVTHLEPKTGHDAIHKKYGLPV